MRYRTLELQRTANLDNIGSVNMTTKHEKNYKYDEYVYCIYLAPAKMSGFEVCAKRTLECTTLCLNESGKNRMDKKTNRINQSRINRTKLFYENRDLFVRTVIKEINHFYKKSLLMGKRFSVRLNNTSDLSPELFYVIENGVKRNLLEIFPHIQFYDYTKIPNRIKLMNKYENYDLTFSFSGDNKDECLTMLDNNIRVAVVFKNTLPNEFWGKKVIDGDLNDLRYLDEKGVIVGLKFKQVRAKLTESYSFVIQ